MAAGAVAVGAVAAGAVPVGPADCTPAVGPAVERTVVVVGIVAEVQPECSPGMTAIAVSLSGKVGSAIEAAR